uniref:RRM domain-containing protein n=1 Tax=Neogobius melanostomus TaxID=47308 RepID=A0A8C6U9W5_9GOBI
MAEELQRDRGKLFIGGLSFATKEDKLAEVFGKYGILEEVDVVWDTDTGRSRGFGFVKYADARRAEDALEAMKGATLDGRAIRVEGVRRWDQFRGGGESGSGPPSGPLKGGLQEGSHRGQDRIYSRRWYGDRLGGCPVGESVFSPLPCFAHGRRSFSNRWATDSFGGVNVTRRLNVVDVMSLKVPTRP